MAYVYRHIRKDKNCPFYIGIGSDSKYKRARERTRRSELWKRIVQKSDYDIEIIADDITMDEAKEKEKEFIALYGRIDLNTGCLANMTDGGDGTLNKVFSAEYRKKLSDKARARVVSESQKEKLREISRARCFTDEQKRQISKKLSDLHKGKPKQPHTIKLLKQRTGINNPMFGRGKEVATHKVTAYRDGIVIGTYFGMYECAKELGLTATRINACLKGRRNHTGGFTFSSEPIKKFA